METSLGNELVNNIKFDGLILKYFEGSIIRYIPLLSILSLIIIPCELYLTRIHMHKFLQFMIIMGVSSLIYYIFRFVTKILMVKISSANIRVQFGSLIQFAIPIFCIVLYQSWEFLILKSKLIDISNKRYLVYFLFFSGMIPIRFLYVIEPSENSRSKMYSFFGILVYLGLKFIT